ncbi:MAG: VanW family protein [Defluviitaleaceae bacterium]|nr:VanW family protein [Defluviitaleaceae bacterium]MCL2835618.1 VanW family protein [Defluviitaleaceae bacterium]
MKKCFVLLIIPVLLLSGCAAGEGGNAAQPIGTVEVQANEKDFSKSSGSHISAFSTEYNENNKSRSHNIRLASEAVDGVIVRPGETFSFNDTVGSTSRSNGYKQATVFLNREKTKGYGGGICQVSTTLYNAAEMAGMEIVERHSHSLDITYIEEGRDATTSHRGKLDFKFENPYDFPVVIRVGNESGTITVEFYVL